MTLVAWWPLHTGGSTAPDLSGNGYSGSVTGTTQVAGLRGLPARDFDGTDDYVDCGSSAGDHFTDGTDFSLCLWANMDVAEINVIADYASKIVGIGYDNPNNTENSFAAYIYDGSWTVVSSGNTTTDRWLFHVLTYDGSANQMEYYIDATSQGTGSVGTPSKNRNYFAIGAQSSNTPQQYFDGSIADVRMYDRKLSLSEIQTLYKWGGG